MENVWRVRQENGRNAGPYSVADLRKLLEEGHLQPSDTAMRVTSAGSVEVETVGNILDPKPEAVPVEAVKVEGRRRPRSLAIVAGAALLISLITVVGWKIGIGSQKTEAGPEIFWAKYRISKNRGLILPPRDNAPKFGIYTSEWLERNFTHYVGEKNAFAWSEPLPRTPAQGKIMAGHQVIAGPEAGELILVATLTEAGGLENMYVPKWLLRPKSEAAPISVTD